MSVRVLFTDFHLLVLTKELNHHENNLVETVHVIIVTSGVTSSRDFNSIIPCDC